MSRVIDDIEEGDLDGLVQSLSLGSTAKKRKKKKKKKKKAGKDIVQRWEEYIGNGALGDWQRFMADLGLNGDFSSKTKCRKALGGVWINIHDFLNCTNKPNDLHFFRSEHELARYTLNNKKVYPRHKIPQESPLRKLLAHIL